MMPLDTAELVAGRRRGLMLVMSSPSGAGKTSISRGLLKREAELVLSISVTTRPQRPGEVDGVDYNFIDQRRFDSMAKAGELLEHAMVYGHGYGTPRAAVEAALEAGNDVLFDIDWQGAQQLREVAAEDMVGIFILPPTLEELASRLRARAQDSEEIVTYRLAQVANDVTHYAEYDYVLINRNLETSINAAQTILGAERLHKRRQPSLNQFVARFRRSG